MGGQGVRSSCPVHRSGKHIMRLLLLAFLLCAFDSPVIAAPAPVPKKTVPKAQGPMEIDFTPLLGQRNFDSTLVLEFADGNIAKYTFSMSGSAPSVAGYDVFLRATLENVDCDAKGAKLTVRGYNNSPVVRAKAVAIGLGKDKQPIVRPLGEKKKR